MRFSVTNWKISLYLFFGGERVVKLEKINTEKLIKKLQT